MNQTMKNNQLDTLQGLKKGKKVYETFRSFYQQGYLNASQLAAIYSEDIVFRDPIHTVHGLLALADYFAALGKNLNSCRFEFIEELIGDDSVHITWQMYFSHRRIAGGREQCVRGMTLIHIDDDKICYHEDCYDLGATVYEHLPLMGRLVRAIRKRLSA